MRLSAWAPVAATGEAAAAGRGATGTGDVWMSAGAGSLGGTKFRCELGFNNSVDTAAKATAGDGAAADTVGSGSDGKASAGSSAASGRGTAAITGAATTTGAAGGVTAADSAFAGHVRCPCAMPPPTTASALSAMPAHQRPQRRSGRADASGVVLIAGEPTGASAWR